MRAPLQPATPTRTALLRAAAGLFARHGYTGVSMRDIARAGGVTPPALYHHFRDKLHFYMEVMALVFGEQTRELERVLAPDLPAPARLERLVAWAMARLNADDTFARLLHRELLDGDESRLRLLTEAVFRAPFEQVAALLAELAPRQDPVPLTVSLFALVLGHVELAVCRPFLPFDRPEYDDPAQVAAHISHLFLKGLTAEKGP